MTLTFLAAGLLAASPAFAEDKDCCAHASTAGMTASCDATFAKLDLTVAQKTKMKKLAAECDKSGCTKESMAKMEKKAQGILSKEQFAAWKAACAGKTADKAQI
jgi:cytolysin (calcineurin-like family phosphatase)